MENISLFYFLFIIEIKCLFLSSFNCPFFYKVVVVFFLLICSNSLHIRDDSLWSMVFVTQVIPSPNQFALWLRLVMGFPPTPTPSHIEGFWVL